MEDMIITVPGKVSSPIIPEDDMEVTIVVMFTWTPRPTSSMTYDRDGTLQVRLSDFNIGRTGSLQITNKACLDLLAGMDIECLSTAVVLRHTITRIVSSDDDRVHAHLMRLWAEHAKTYFQV